MSDFAAAEGVHTRVVALQTGPTDAEVARDLRDRLAALLVPLADLMSESDRKGMMLGFSLSPPDAMNRVHVTSMTVTKKLL